MKKLISMLFMVAMTVFFTSCSEDDAAPETGSLAIEFDAYAGTQNLVLGTGVYQNSLDQDFSVDVLRYYISNIRLKRQDGTFYEDPMSEDGSKGYYLIDDSDAASTIVTLEDVPADHYIGAEFTIGVDANRVSQGAQTGALDPANNLFWSWNAGYIFVQLEGTSPQSNEEDDLILFHVGGYKTDVANPNLKNNIRVKSISFGGDEAHVSASAEPEIHVIVDIKKFFEGGTVVDFSTTAPCHSPTCGESIANNYVEAFVFDHMHQ
ncbi:MAG: hypothetical protein KF856_11135 [Cyclobacteriaceae bacterium]|nr:hypothetical protein [Cyclobacteriaceae bacterium]